MALAKYGAGIIQLSGSIGGTVFARNRYGNYARARTIPTNPNTSRQQDVRSAVAALSDRWAQTLTALQRAAWGLYGDSVNMLNRLGEVVHLSGYNHYIRSNAFRARSGLTIIDAGPVIFELPDHDPSYAIAIAESTQQVSTTFDNTLSWANETGAYMLLAHGMPQNAQRNFFDGPYRVIGATAGDNAIPPTSPAVNAIGWPVATGQHNWCRARISRLDGRLSTPFRADCFVTAI